MQGDALTQASLSQWLQSHSEGPLLTFQDAEWGVGMRLTDVASLPKNATLGKVANLTLLHEYGLELARQCRSNGILANFAPVCDVRVHPDNPITAFRSLSSDPKEVAERAVTIFEGMRKGGLLACAKHFPGHGDTLLDSHKGLPQIGSMELAPFEALIDAGVEMVMMGHLVYPAISQEPASLSKEMIQGVLRGQLGFKGVVVTDSLDMGALRGYGSLGEICERALLAGNDLLLIAPLYLQNAFALVEKEIGEAIEYLERVISPDLIEEKCARIDCLRNRLLPPIPEENPGLTEKLIQSAEESVADYRFNRYDRVEEGIDGEADDCREREI